MRITVTIEIGTEEELADLLRRLGAPRGEPPAPAPIVAEGPPAPPPPEIPAPAERGRRQIAKSFTCPVCGRAMAPQGKRRHMMTHEQPAAGEPPPMVPSPEPKTVPVAKLRLTDKICVSAVDATFDGKTIAAWADAMRFRGNLVALTAWANAVVKSTNKPMWKAMSVADQERYVLRIVGGKIKEEALAGGS